MMWEKTPESPLDSKEIQPVYAKGNQSWIFFWRTDAEASILWPADTKNWLIRKDPDVGKDSGRRKRGRQKTRWLDGIIDSMDMNLSKLREIVKDMKPGVLQSIGSQNQTWLSNWTTTRFDIAFLSRSKHLLIAWMHSWFTVILETKKIKSVTVSSFFPIYLPWSDGTECHDLSFLNVEL